MTPKEFETLLVLVEAGGRVVEKEDLIGRVWPDSYVGDGSLARNISVLRKALGEGVIETLPKKGYRIRVPVSRVQVTRELPVAKSRVESNEQPSPPGSRRATEPAARWRTRRGRVWSAMASVVLILVVFRFVGINSAKMPSSVASVTPIHSILIQQEGALDPLAEGFGLDSPDGKYEHVLRNSESKGFDRRRLICDDQNFYYRRLSAEEKNFALQHDWKLTCICALESGAGFAIVDFAGKGARFDIEFVQERNQYFVTLLKQVSPTIEFDVKIEFAGVGDVAHPHTYELHYDHLNRTASLWIDGKQMASGYRGHHQFQQDYGLFFGAEIYGSSPKGSVVFRRVRFEAN